MPSEPAPAGCVSVVPCVAGDIFSPALSRLPSGRDAAHGAHRLRFVHRGPADPRRAASGAGRGSRGLAMRTLRYNVAASLDGFLADAQGAFDWIPDDSAIDFESLFERVDTYLLGR